MLRWSAAALLVLATGLAIWGLTSRSSHPDLSQVERGNRSGSSNDPATTCLPPGTIAEYSPLLVKEALDDAHWRGNARRGAAIFGSAHFACLSCHKVGQHGGEAGPELTNVGQRLAPSQIVEGLYWPRREVRPEYRVWMAQTTTGQSVQGYLVRKTADEVEFRDPARGTTTVLPRSELEELREVGTLMPEGLVAAMSPTQRADVVRFLSELKGPGPLVDLVQPTSHEAAAWSYSKPPLNAERWPFQSHFVNRDRLYDFYTKEARHFLQAPVPPVLLPAYPGIDGGTFGHWGNQNEQTWASERWNSTDLGSLQAAIFRGAGVTVPKGVCVRLGERGELSTCFNPETLRYEALWKDGFLKFSSVRHGFMDGGLMAGEALPPPASRAVPAGFTYRGFYRHGREVAFLYRVGETDWLDVPRVKDGALESLAGPLEGHPLRALTQGGPAQWPQVFELPGQPGSGGPYVVDRIPPPWENPWKAQMFFSGHDFTPDGTAYVCTMQGDVWQVSGLDANLAKVRWKRFASGLNQPLGLKVVEGLVHVLGRDQLTRLHDLNGDGEADFYECASNAYTTSPAGHDFICGLERDGDGNFYTASGNQGLLRISPDGRRVEVLATGFRNPDGLGLMPDGSITVPCSEGEWTPASTLCLVRPQSGESQFEPPHFGYLGPRNGQRPTLPLMYIPRGLDNSAGGQVAIEGERWGPLREAAVHLSFGTATHFLLLRDEVDGQPQGGLVPLPGEFSSGVHRGRFGPHDGQLYVSGMAGWGAYNSQEGCFERVRYTGDRVQLPRAFHVHQNGVLVEFSSPVTPEIAGDAAQQFAQSWNYRYSAAYGSEEYSPSHRGAIGHDAWAITRAVVLSGGRRVFYEIPDLQPVSQLHLHLAVEAGEPVDLFLTVHALDAPFTSYPGHRPVVKTIAAHPLLVDLSSQAQSPPNPWREPIPEAREIVLEAGKNLSFSPRDLSAQPGEPLKLVFRNPDVVPHNFVLIRPGQLQVVGQLANRFIASPEAVVRHYVPFSDDVLAYTDVVPPGKEFAIFLRAPESPGKYPFLCSFPGHWMAMNGVLSVSPRR